MDIQLRRQARETDARIAIKQFGAAFGTGNAIRPRTGGAQRPMRVATVSVVMIERDKAHSGLLGS
jgi:hypothetical protein